MIKLSKAQRKLLEAANRHENVKRGGRTGRTAEALRAHGLVEADYNFEIEPIRHTPRDIWTVRITQAGRDFLTPSPESRARGLLK